MMTETAPGQARVTTGGPAGPGPTREARQTGRLDGMVRYGVLIAVVSRTLGDRRLQARVITGVLGAYALASLIRNNEARPLRRAMHWYDTEGKTKK